MQETRTRAQVWVNEGPRSVLRLHTRRLATLRAAGFQRLTGFGAPSVSIALIDGAIDCGHPALGGARIVGGTPAAFPSSHATFIASIFAGGGPHSLGICRHCTIVSLPDLTDDFAAGRLSRQQAAAILAGAVYRAATAGVDVIHTSVEFSPSASEDMTPVARAVAFAAERGIRTVCAAGNQPVLGSAATIAAPGFVPVAAADTNGRLAEWSAVSPCIGACGLSAPGIDIPGAVGRGWGLRSGSSVAAALVTGAFAFLRAAYPALGRERIWSALLAGHRSIVPPSLDAAAAFERLKKE